MDNEIPKYKKKTKSNTSKSKEKSNHKHSYKECLLIHERRPYLGTYCTICGKIYNWCLPVITKEENGFRRMMTDEEVFEAYNYLERKEIKDLWAKYLPVEG